MTPDFERDGTGADMKPGDRFTYNAHFARNNPRGFGKLRYKTGLILRDTPDGSAWTVQMDGSKHTSRVQKIYVEPEQP